MFSLLDAINQACEKLPLNYHLRLDIENGYAGISIYGPGGELNFDTTDMTLTDQVLEAVYIVEKINHQVEKQGTK